MKEAIHIATNIQGLTFSFGDDGVWLNVGANNKYTSINLSNYAKEGGAITNGLLEWCKQTAQNYSTEQGAGQTASENDK